MKYYLGLRGKLVIVTISVLILPVASYYYLLELESFLKQNQLKNQLDTTKILASVFEQTELIEKSNKIHNGQPPIYAHLLNNSPIIDGYEYDWESMQLNQQIFYHQNNSEKFSLIAGHKENKLFFFIKVIDESIQYKLSQDGYQSDRIDISLFSATSKQENYHIHTEAPGWFVATSTNPENQYPANQIRGEWQENTTGYQVEFSLNLSQLNQFLSITVYDNGRPSSTLAINTPQNKQISSLNPLIIESTLLSNKLQKIHNKLLDGQLRLYLINKFKEVVARSEQLSLNQLVYRKPDNYITHLTNIYTAIIDLDIQNQRYFGPLSHLEGSEIDEALGVNDKQLQASSAWLAGSNSQVLILSTAAPVLNNSGKVIGAVVMEKTNAAILALQDQTFERLLLISLLLFFTTGVILLFYSGRLVKRILKLKISVDSAMNQEGKLNHQFQEDMGSDEIGQLSRSFATLHKKLNRYTDYLESMVSKLSHELRTPLSIIKSSLENIQYQGVSENQQAFFKRAMNASERLSQMLTRMGESSRLDKALQSSENEKIDINQFIMHYFDAIKLANPDTLFILKLPDHAIESFISPELISQLLDKLLSNAISFHKPDSEIVVELIYNPSKSSYIIDIFNQGHWIPEAMENSIFDSMVSHREKNNSNAHEVHLGLGLHIACLIAEHNQGSLNYINRKSDYNLYQGEGVSFILELPCQ